MTGAKVAGAVARGTAMLAAYQGAAMLVDRLVSEAHSHLLFTVTVTDADPLYHELHRSLLSELPDRGNRNLMVGRRRGMHDPREDRTFQVSYNETRARRLTIGGQRVVVQVSRPDRGRDSDGLVSTAPDAVEFRCWTEAGRQAVLTYLKELHEQHQRRTRRPRLMITNQWGEWRSRDDLPPRPIRSVTLPAEQKARIVGDLQRFLAAEDRYNELAIPWHRAYLFHGPPGTGKTSLARALASEFGLDLWYLSLSDVKEESTLLSRLAQIEPRGVLLLEDVDAVQMSHDREAQQGTVGLGALLNALDGVTTPHGLITILTTNHVERLDPALTRPGRVDCIEELGPIGAREVGELYENFYGKRLRIGEMRTRPAAEVAEVLKSHLDDAAGARRALIKLEAA